MIVTDIPLGISVTIMRLLPRRSTAPDAGLG
jgi:hypothetical protein